MLATLTAFKARYGIPGTADDVNITGILKGVSAQLAVAAGRSRGLELVGRTQLISVLERTPVLHLDCWPIVSVSSLLQSLSADFTGETEVSSDSYRIDAEAGCLLAVGWNWCRGVNSVQVIYTGGYTAGLSDYLAGTNYAANDLVIYLGQVYQAKAAITAATSTPAADTAHWTLTSQVAMPDDIVEATLQQAGFVWQRRDNLGLSGGSLQGGSFSAYNQDALLPGVRETMSHYARKIG